MRINHWQQSRNCLFSLLVMALAFYVTSTSAKNSEQVKQELPLSELKAFSEAYFQIKSSYVDDVEDVDLIRAAISGMVSSLDVHSRYLSPDDLRQFNTDNVGEYEGVGLSFNDHKYGIEVVEVVSGGPADKAGIEPGMIVTHIDKEAIQYLPVSEALTKLKGPIDSTVILTVAAAKFAKPKDIALQREVIVIASVASQSLPNRTAYVGLSSFTMHSVEEFKNAITSLSEENAIANLILDLRDNPGGVMDVAVELSDLFIPEGTLLISSGRTDDANEIFYAKQAAPFSDLKVVVVINKGSASASEILAAALKDHGKAVVLGETSYGKGSIQTLIPLNYESGMKITTAEYYSPLGNRIQDVGIKPDIKFDQQKRVNSYNVSLLDDPQLLQAYNILLKQ
ncbi:S41 family peptidase [Aliikangiella marina]|uniref:S41 family peptidase n=1 Tax=Aliikangiella marina TaxID=1712262 RepID=A0A545T126_9GAMM|nr:S41 family peptidase [Aliikangiella marina]TQV70917.1 S41 family peptidase [Aliikangiella marina]